VSPGLQIHKELGIPAIVHSPVLLQCSTGVHAYSHGHAFANSHANVYFHSRNDSSGSPLMIKMPTVTMSLDRGHGYLGFTYGIMVQAFLASVIVAWIQPDGYTASQRARMVPLVFAEPRRCMNKELVGMSLRYARKGRLAPTTQVVAPVCSPEEAMKDVNWLGSGIYTSV
jgi:hypothetical protein